MRGNTSFLLDHVKVAIAALKGGLDYNASDETELWMVSTLVIKGRLTGKIAVGCLDSLSLEELSTELRGLGHTVEPGRNLKTKAIVPDTIVVTPAS